MHRLFFIIVVIIAQGLVAEKSDYCAIIDCLDKKSIEAIDHILPNTYTILEVTFSTNGILDQSEIKQLCDIHSHSTGSRLQIKSSCYNILLLDKLASAHVFIKQTKMGYVFHIVLKQHIIFDGLSIKGYFRGKDQYKNCYIMQPGDIFDEKKHEMSLKNIQNYFHERGYWGYTIESSLLHNDVKKTVHVSMALKKGGRFLLDKTCCVINSIDSVHVEKELLESQLYRICLQKIENKYYSKSNIDWAKNRIHELLARRGFINFSIMHTETVDQKNKVVSVKFLINVERKKEFSFKGNTVFSKQEFLENILMYGKSAWHFPHSIIVDELKQMYEKKGYFNTNFEIVEKGNVITCSIVEGVRAQVKNVFIEDLNFYSESYLKKHYVNRLVRNKYYDKELLKSVIQELVTCYRSQGFWDASIVCQEDISDDTSMCNITLFVTEGYQRLWGSIYLGNFKFLLREPIFESCRFERPFDREILLRQKDFLKNYLNEKGYIESVIAYELEEKDNYVNVAWNIRGADEPIRFGKIIVVGKTQIPFSSIKNDLCFSFGECWNKKLFDESMQKLKSRDCFKSVYLYPGKELDNDQHRPVFIKCLEADPFEIRMRLGMQQVGKNLSLRSGWSYKLGGSLLMRNACWYGDQLRFDSDTTRYYRNNAMMYSVPWMFASSMNMQIKAYDMLYYQPVYIGSKVSLYGASQQGGLLHCGWNRHYGTITISTGFEAMGLRKADVESIAETIDYNENFVGKKNKYFFFEPTIMVNQVDALLFPTRGFRSVISCKGMFDICSKNRFFKLLAEHTLYYPLAKSAVLAIRARSGHIFNQCFKNIIPIERFFLGGANTIRGYERDYVPPLGLLKEPIHDGGVGLPKSADCLWKYAPQGGRTMINANIELRFLLGKGFGLNLFNDFGVLVKDSVKNSFKSVLGGSGLGVRYDTPVGSLRFDIGFKWKRLFKDFESPYVWYFTLGQAF